jgi:molecular chaperone DnaJ
VRIDIDLPAAVFGQDREFVVDTAMQCSTCTGSGCAADSGEEVCTVCKGRGEMQQVQRSFLGQVMTSRPCPQCRGFGTTIPHPCPECAGEGRVRTRRTLAVRIPPGVDTGTRIQLTGEGEVGPNGGPPADLFVEISVERHPMFERIGDELHCKVAVPMTAATLGTRLELQTLDGLEELEVRPGTQGGSVLVVKGRGAARLRTGARGDLHVHLDVTTPTKLDAEQERLLREFAAARGEDLSRVVAEGPDSGGLFSKIKDAFTR